ncbi:MAG: hypothetical protein ICV68_18565 [Pyrinomonadaceae bacterium]|nr:hypothetical protein [Pyrinomonadaceae bacterium]
MLAWRFGGADKGGPFAWTNLSNSDYRRVLEKSYEFENMEQKAIQASGSHPISIDRLSKEAQNRLTEIELDDIDELMSFRITGAERIFCRADQGVMRVLWWDPNHGVCPSTKRHT